MFLIRLTHILRTSKRRRGEYSSMTSKLLTSTLRRALPSLKSNAPIVKAAGAQQQQARCSLSTTMTSMTTSTSLSPPSQQCAFSTLSPAIHSYNESVSEMTNEQLADPTTIPGFTTLIHSPPKDRSTTPRRALFGKVDSRFTPSITSA